MQEFVERLQLDPQAFYRQLFQSCPDALIGVGQDGLIAFASPAAMGMFGTSHDVLIGAPIEALVPDAARVAHRSDRAKYQQAPRARPMGLGRDLRARRLDDGHEFGVDISLTPITVADAVYVVAWVRDTAERGRDLDVARMSQALAAISTTPTAPTPTAATPWWRSPLLPIGLGVLAVVILLLTVLLVG